MENQETKETKENYPFHNHRPFTYVNYFKTDIGNGILN
jgi:hypothetical protein